MGASAETSTAPVTQIITYTIPVGGLPECVNEGLGMVCGADGFKGAFKGLRVDDEKVGYWIFQWESIEKRDAFLKNPAHTAMLMAVKALTDARSDEGEAQASQLQVLFGSLGAEDNIFDASVTEVAMGTLKDGASSEEYEQLLDNVVRIYADVQGAKGAVWGKVAAGRSKADGENRTKYVLAVGWESEEAYSASKPVETGRELHEKICALADYESELVKLERHDKSV